MITIEGDVTTARVMGLEPGELEESAREQITDIVNHEGFENEIIIMPDVHVGSGAIIGFTMKLGTRIIPNVIGVDIGCGMQAVKLEELNESVRSEDTESGLNHDVIEKHVRDTVPMGWGPDGLQAPEREYYHVKNQFPWETANERLESFINSTTGEHTKPLQSFLDDGGYDIEYFKELCEERAGRMSTYFNTKKGISSVGTLGSGNHFLEIGQSDETGEYWIVVHSGSRGLGENTAKYHQQRAIKLRDGRADTARDELRELVDEYDESFVKFDVEEVSDEALLDWLQGGMGESFVDYDAIQTAYADTPEKIEVVGNEFKSVIPTEEPASVDRSMDWLEGEEQAGYFRDMIFCQLYAVESRKMMAEAAADALGASITDEITSVHNFIDFRDNIIRKGATRSYNGERAVIPFNMRDGTVIVEGKSNEQWNKSVAHGAGRTMSRMKAKELTTSEELQADLERNGVFAGSHPADESPIAYKEADRIQQAVSETADVIDRLEVVHNFKAND